MKQFDTLRLFVRYLPMAILLLLPGGGILAQTTKTATGTVVDEGGKPIVGVTVISTASPQRGATTDQSGKFSLTNIANGEILQFSFVGMDTQQLPFKLQPMQVVMKSSNVYMNEVLVVAYGEQKRSAFTGSASVVTADEIAIRPVTNVMEALEGRTPGLQIQSTSGAPGSSSSFRVRGASSISAGKDPLIIVDGTPYESGINNINPSDVESVTVLKDAASTAIYGARGGNGVILITTKKGTINQGVTVKFDAKFAVTQKRNTDMYDVIDDPGEYYERHYDAMYNYFTNVTGLNTQMANQAANASWTKNSDEGGLGYLIYTVPGSENLIGYNGRLNPNAKLGRMVKGVDGNMYYQRPDDWVDETYQTGFRQDYNMSVSGGTNKLSVLGTAGYTNETGITAASGYERFTGRLKGTFTPKKWLRISGNIDLAVSATDNNTDYSDNSNNVFSNASRVAPIYPVYIRDEDQRILRDANGKVYDYGDGTYNDAVSRPINTGSNRIQESLIQTRRTESTKIGGQGAIDLTIVKGLTATANVAYSDRNRRVKTTGQPFYGTSNPGGNVYIYSYKDQTINTQQIINYSTNFGNHSLKATVLHELYKYKYAYLYATKSNMFSYFENQELAGAITLNNANSYTREYQSEGFGGRVLYDYNDIYHFDASYRRDASSRFHKDHRWGNFFSFGAAYVISNEAFFKVPWVDMLKVKFSVGQNGNDQIGTSYNRYEDSYEIGNANGEIALTFNTRGNKSITWETRTAINAGVEFELFKGRLRGGVEYYNNKTTDMLASVSVPYSLGYSSYWSNVGSMRNRGFEVELQGTIIQTRDVRWSMYVNASTNKGTVLKLAKERTGETLYNLDGEAVARGYSSSPYFYGEGLEYKTWRLKKFAGIDDAGKAMWFARDDKTGEISKTTTYSSATYFDCGSSQAKVIGGFGGSVAWKSLELSFSFAYRIGGYAYDSGYATLMNNPYNGRTGYNYHVDTYKSWTPEQPSGSFARWQYDDKYFTSSSDRWLTKADFLSLQNITLAYTLPDKFTSKIGLKKTVVSVGVDNPLFISHRKGFIPSRDFDGNVDFGYYPEITRYLFNLSFSF